MNFLWSIFKRRPSFIQFGPWIFAVAHIASVYIGSDYVDVVLSGTGDSYRLNGKEAAAVRAWFSERTTVLLASKKPAPVAAANFDTDGGLGDLDEHPF